MKRIFLLFSSAVASALILFALNAGDAPKTGPASEKRFPPLSLPPGFKATLFACDPLIEYPSVIAAGPRPGAIFVAIDYMTGLGSDGKVKSEIRLVEDTNGDGYADKATVVAKGFNSIQGLAYHDDTLFVMHAPFLTAVPKPGAHAAASAEQKHLLTGLGLPPEKNSSRLHCANGVTVGHDGWLYLALGDNGVNVLRLEGDRLIHNGGAILRCRPDGRDLHVFSTGLRNIYDIALDAELNVFTRDNENDGGTYMIRVCHAFHGSDHGYPYDYYERPDHAMKPIGDFDLGSSAGGVCYLETQFPPAYRGNLFFGEWGKSVVRYELKRAASGFAPVKEIEFASGNPKDAYPFKPTDVIVQRDGTLMVSDYADGQRPKRGRGRIYHIAHVGQGVPPVSKDSTLASKLNSESYFDRWEAQKIAAHGGRAALAQLDKAALGQRARLHLIWARARTDGANALDGLLRMAKEDPDPGVRAQAVRAIADLADPVLVKHKLNAGRGDAKLAERLAALGVGQDARVQLEMVIALGRLRWAGAPEWLGKNLRKPDAALAHAAMQTLRRADNWPAVLRLLDQPNAAPIRTIAVRALSDQFDATVADALIQRLGNEPNSDHQGEYAEVLARIHKAPGPWKYWGYRPGPRPANTERWARTQAIEAALNRLLGRKGFVKRAEVLKAMEREKVPIRLETLVGLLKNEFQPEGTKLVLAALAGFPPADTRRMFDEVVRDRRHSAENRIAALKTLLKLGGDDPRKRLMEYVKTLEDGLPLAEVLNELSVMSKPESVALFVSKLKSKDAHVRAAALTLLAGYGDVEAVPFVLPFLKDSDAAVRLAATRSAGRLNVKEAAGPLLKLAPDPRFRGACLDSLRLLRDGRAVPIALASLREGLSELKALHCLADLGGPEHVRAVVDFAKRRPSTPTLTICVRVLAGWRSLVALTPDQRKAMDRAIAEIHGATGILVRWHARGPSDRQSLQKNLKQSAPPGKAFPPSGWRTLFAGGAEGRLALAPRVEPKNPLWLAGTEVQVADATPIEFLASGRGSLEVWLNGTSIYRRAKDKNFQIDSDRFHATLLKGGNRLLVQTGGSSPIEFHLRFRRKSAKAQHEKLIQAALTRTGNAGRGSKIFFDKEKSQCLKCHSLANQGERIGPDLTGIGKRFSRIHIIESILEPSRSIAPSFGTLIVTTKNGKTFNGVKVADDEKALTLADNQGAKHVIARAGIDDVQASPISIMPDGLEQRLTADEFVDLIAFLTSQQNGAR